MKISIFLNQSQKSHCQESKEKKRNNTMNKCKVKKNKYRHFSHYIKKKSMILAGRQVTVLGNNKPKSCETIKKKSVLTTNRKLCCLDCVELPK